MYIEYCECMNPLPSLSDGILLRLTELVEEEMAAGKHLRINDYHFLKTLGKGAYGEVRLATKDLVEHDLSQHTRFTDWMVP